MGLPSVESEGDVSGWSDGFESTIWSRLVESVFRGGRRMRVLNPIGQDFPRGC
jgi:hypothetical protein